MGEEILQMKLMNFFRYSRMELKLVGIPCPLGATGFFSVGGPADFLRITDMSE
jgi:hypothetical protein